MGKYAAFGSTPLSSDQVTPEDLATSQPSELVRGARAGTYGLGSSLRNSAAAVGDAFNFDQFAAEQYGEADRLARRAQETGPRVGSLDQLKQGGYSLRDSLDYAAGVMGAAAPSIGVGVGTSLLARGRTVPSLLAGTAAFTPLETGDAVAKWREANPDQQIDAGTLARLGATGAGSAAFQSIVPTMVGGKLMGRGMASTPTTTLRGAVGRNLAEIPMEGFTEGAGELIKQTGATPDLPTDWGQIGENAVAGMIGGAPMAGLGAAGDYAHGNAGVMADAARSGTAAIGRMVQGASDMTAKATGPATAVAKDGWSNVGDLARAAYEGTVEGFKASDLGKTLGERAGTTRSWAAEMLDDPATPENIKENLRAASEGAGNKINQAYVWAAKQARAASKAVSDAVPPSAKSMASDALRGLRAKVDDTVDRVIEDRFVGDEAAMASATPERAADMTAESDRTAAQRAKEWGDEILSRAGVSEETKAKVSQAMSDLGDRANRATVAAAKKTADAASAVKERVQSFKARLDAERRKAQRADVDVEARVIPEPAGLLSAPKKSEDYAGARAAINDVLTKYSKELPAETLSDPETAKDLADGLRRFVEIAARPDAFDTFDKHWVRAQLGSMLGPRSTDILNDVFDAVGSSEPDAVVRRYAALNDLDEMNKQAMGLVDVLKGSLPEGSPLIARQSQDAEILSSWARGDLTKGMSPEQAKFEDRRMKEYIEETYGEKSKAVLSALEKQTTKKTDLRVEKAKDQDGADEDQGDVDEYDGTMNIRDADEPNTSYVGGNTSGKVLVSDPAVYRAKDKSGREGSTERLIKKLKDKNPGAGVRFVSIVDKPELVDMIPSLKAKVTKEKKALAEQYPGDADRQMAALEQFRDKMIADLKAEGMGMIEVVNNPNPDALTQADIEAMRMDTERYGKKDHPSRLEVKNEEGEAEHIFDAMSVSRTMMAKINKERTWTVEDDRSDGHRLARAFSDGVAALMEKYGRFKVSPDTLIGRVGGKDFFARDIKALEKDAGENFREGEPGDRDAWGVNRAPTDTKVHLRRKYYEQDTRTAAQLQEQLDNLYMRIDDALESGEDGFVLDRLYSRAEKLEEKLAKADPKENVSELLQDAGKYGADPANDNIVTAGNALSERELRRPPTSGLKSTPLNNKPLLALAEKIRESNAVGRDKIADRLQTLALNAHMMGAKDQAKLMDLRMAKKISEVTETINGLARKYADKIVAPGKPGLPDQMVRKAEGSPDPKAPAAKKAAAPSGSQTVAALNERRTDKSFMELTGLQRSAVGTAISKMADVLQAAAAKIITVAETGLNRGMTYVREGAIGINFGALSDDVRWHDSMSRPDRLAWTLSHELGHIVDAASGWALSTEWAANPALLAELQDTKGFAKWVLDYPATPGLRNAQREYVAQLVALNNHNQELLNAQFPKNAEWIRSALGARQGDGAETIDAGAMGEGRAGNGRDARDDGPADTVKAKRAALLKRAASGDAALLKELSASTDAKGLQRAVQALNEVDLTDANEANIVKAVDAINARLGELMQDPDVAYGMGTKKYSLLSTEIHNDLQRGGFAATHDSPIRHEGKFDWRAYTGLGEGNAAFGAGTYLSTGDKVHAFYKKMMSNKTEQLRDLVHAVIGTGPVTAEAKAYALEEARNKVAEYKERLAESVYPPDAQEYRQGIEEWSQIERQLSRAKIGVPFDMETKSPTYHVSVGIMKAQLLNWDKPLSEQSSYVKKRLEGVVEDMGDAWESGFGTLHYASASDGSEVTILKGPGGHDIRHKGEVVVRGAPTVDAAKKQAEEFLRSIGLELTQPGTTGEDIYRYIAYVLGSQAAASDYLQSLGILGHEYAASNGRDGKTPNYVIYDDSKIQTNYVHFSAQRAAGAGMSQAAQKQVLAAIQTMLGNSVQVEFKKLPHAGEYQRVGADDVIRISVHALNPTTVAYHESLHAFFAKLMREGGGSVADVLMRATQDPAVNKRLRELLAGEPAALRQLADPEERAAYMFQFWAAGDQALAAALKGEARSFLQRVVAMLRKVLGIWSNEERALHIMEAFSTGKYAQNLGNPSAFHRAMMDPGRNAAVEAARSLTKPLLDLGGAVVSAGSARLRESGIPSLVELADLTKRPLTADGGDPGFVPAARLERTRVLNALGAKLGNLNETDVAAVLEILQSGAVANTTPEQRLAARDVRTLLADQLQYLRAAGVTVNDLGPDYFPRVYDPVYISKHQAEFQAVLSKYGIGGDTMQRIIADGGADLTPVVDRPGMQAKRERSLAMIPDAELAPFMQKDLYQILNSYVSQSTRRAEWARRFGDDSSRLHSMLAQARTEGATDDQIKAAEKYVRGVNGTLGDDINPTARRLMGDMIVYQNIRLLPLAIFSSVVDPMGILVRGGEVKDAWTAFKRGVREIPKGLKGDTSMDESTRLADMLGVVDNAALVHDLGALYSQGMVGNTARKINDSFFRFNLMEQFNRSMRVGATEAALKFMERHSTGKTTVHSARWMRELGLMRGDVQVVNGRVALTQADGLTAAQEARIRTAVNRWVDGAVLRPDAADKPIWMNDPHWALVAHLKQFVYAFHHTILKRVAHEMRNGNYTPAMALASYVPIMIAADAAKGMLQNGGDEPEWKKNWGFEDYVAQGVQRAGLLGVGQLGVDAYTNLQRGGTGVGALAGPTLEQMGEALQVMGGTRQFDSFLLRAMPANALYADYVKGDGAAAE